MFKNYLKIAFRNLTKHKIYSFINVIGLAIGIACCILIFLFVENELSYDTFHKHADSIYRVYVTEDLPTRDPFSYSHTPAPMAGAMEQSFPDVIRAVRVETSTDNVRLGDRNFTERYHLVDSDFFEMFSFGLVRGNPATALRDLNSIVLSEQMAEKFFGGTDVLERRLTVKLGNEFHEFTVTGIAANVPQNSSIEFDILIPWENARKFRSERVLSHWFNVYLETYVQMSAPLETGTIESKLAAVVKNHYPERSHSMVTLHLQPMQDIHLNPDIPAGNHPTSDPVYSYILIGIALLILGIACINFMTLAVGRSATRAKEVGVRKVLGAFRSQLAKQFWGEALLMSFVALFLGMALATGFLPIFNELANKELSLSVGYLTISVLVALMLLVGLIAGSYPALVL
ncbi:ABC transporter permease, partial [bacterium]|nr:ABC transporter permease [bacterium]